MRIIGGVAGGTLLNVPKGFDVRPTPDLVRQALFNSLGDRVEGAAILELFGGTGAISLECLSRGAASAICVEKSAKHVGFIRRNLAATRLDASKLQIRTQDVQTAIEQLAHQGRTFDLILADPPYGEKNVGRRSESFAQRLLDDPTLPKLLRRGILVVGHTKRDSLTIPDGWVETRSMKHGDSVLGFYVSREDAAVTGA